MSECNHLLRSVDHVLCVRVIENLDASHIVPNAICIFRRKTDWYRSGGLRNTGRSVDDAQLDTYFYVAGWPVAAMVQLSSTKGMNIYSFSEEELAKINDIIPS